MGRSVSTPYGSVAVYEHFDFDEHTEFSWEVIKPFQEQLEELFPSVIACDKWLGREDHAVASNDHAYFGVSEYCGLVAYWVVPRDDNDHPALSEQWVARIANKFTGSFGVFRKTGSMSNGEGVYAAK